MTVKITMEFDNAEQAIVALGKITGIATAAPKERKGRNDAGKPRGQRATPQPEPEAKGAGVGAPAGSAASTAAPSATPAPAASSQPNAAGGTDPGKVGEKPANPTSTTEKPAAPIPTQEATETALSKLFDAAPPLGGIEAARDVMSRFGVKRLRDLPEDKRAEFIALADKVLAGGKA